MYVCMYDRVRYLTDFGYHHAPMLFSIGNKPNPRLEAIIQATV